jgi:hypothetical protein
MPTVPILEVAAAPGTPEPTRSLIGFAGQRREHREADVADNLDGFTRCTGDTAVELKLVHGTFLS